MISKILIALFLVLGSAVGYVYFTGGTGLPEFVKTKLSFIPQRSSSSSSLSVSDTLAAVQVPALPENTSEQLKTMTARTGELSASVGQVLGEAVKVATPAGESSLQERAFDYGRYLYCQQVVKDYEARTKIE